MGMLDGRIALITGGGKGIGKGIALQLAKNGYDVGIHYSTTADGALDTQKQARELGARAELFHADIRNVDEIHAMFDEFFNQSRTSIITFGSFQNWFNCKGGLMRFKTNGIFQIKITKI